MGEKERKMKGCRSMEIEWKKRSRERREGKEKFCHVGIQNKWMSPNVKDDMVAECLSENRMDGNIGQDRKGTMEGTCIKYEHGMLTHCKQ